MTDRPDLGAALAAAYPELAAVAAVAPDPVYLVGGAVRDLILGRGRADIDLVVEGDPAALAAALGAEPLVTHPRFGTMKVDWNGEELDLAASRRESYARPGALPTVELGAPIRTDLARRDFTVNAMAIPLADPTDLLDPYDGQVDLREGLLRAIHDRSFLDDPTRAIRAARYAGRFGFELEPGTRDLLLATDLGTVTPERRAEELRRMAAEERGVRGLELLAGWGLVEPRPGGESFALARDVERLLAMPAWAGEVDRPDAILAAAGVLEAAPTDGREVGTVESPGDEEEISIPAAGADRSPAADPVFRRAAELATARPTRPSEGAALARGVDPLVLVLARGMGAGWLDNWLDWRQVRLEIGGADLTAAGLSGPAVGRGLDAALAAKLDGEAPNRADELRVALAAAGA
jgi:tRNA nucleotidyltransferase (CCA-adding enzyme)